MKLTLKNILFITFLSLLSTQVLSSKKDSLLNLVKGNLNDSLKSKAYRELMYDCSKDEKEKAHYYFEKSIKHAQKIQNDFLIGETYNYLSAFY